MSVSQDNIKNQWIPKRAGQTTGPLSVFNRLAESLSTLLRKGPKENRRIKAIIFLGIISPVLFIAAFAYYKTYTDLTDSTLARRQAIAHLAATALEQRFNRVIDLGISLATRVRFRQLVSEEKWDEAVEVLKDVPVDFPFIDRLFLADAAGTLMADVPALPGVRGKNFAARDWFQGVSANWRPYVSDVYKRTAEPRLNVVAVAIPIKAEKQRITGILVLQIQLNELVGWSNSIQFGPSGSVYFIDKKGHLATHRSFPSKGELVNFLKMPVVQKVLRGETGVEMMFNPVEAEEQIAAYAPLTRVGWGVIASEPREIAFAGRDAALTWLLILYGFIILISCVFAHVMLRTVNGLKLAEEKIQLLNDDLRQRAVQLQTANEELEAFSYSVSHDLRAPLRAIDGFGQALVEDCSDKLGPEGKDYLGRICAASQRMAQLIDDLLNLSRLSRTPMTRKPVNFSALAGSVVSELRKADPERPVDTVIAEGIMVDGDERLLRVVLDNLIGNAWKFTGKCAQPKIEFGTVQNNGTGAYFVRDNGAGFDMNYANKLFSPFQRLHGMTEFKGTGIGLATVQRILHRHGGRVWAEAHVGKGATFYFSL